MHSSHTRTSEPRRGLWYFVRDNVTVPVALFTGLACIVATIIFTTWLSKQVLRCPTWSTSCSVSYRVESIRNSIGTVQGLVTAVYVIGMASVAYAAHSLAESALWPVLSKQALTIKQISTYLEASRGSIPSSPLALFAARNFDSTLVLLCTVIITIVPLSSAPLVGYVYDQQNVSVGFESRYKQGGGTGPYYIQKIPQVQSGISQLLYTRPGHQRFRQNQCPNIATGSLTEGR
jgi:hypothetical protein